MMDGGDAVIFKTMTLRSILLLWSSQLTLFCGLHLDGSFFHLNYWLHILQCNVCVCACAYKYVHRVEKNAEVPAAGVRCTS